MSILGIVRKRKLCVFSESGWTPDSRVVLIKNRDNGRVRDPTIAQLYLLTIMKDTDQYRIDKKNLLKFDRWPKIRFKSHQKNNVRI